MGKVKKSGAVRQSSQRKSVKSKRAAIRGRQAAGSPARTFSVRPLDPLQKCGPNTSVQLMYRVDERSDEGTRVHLVFFDRHGWYCEHGRDCAAVSHARKCT
jgi:hypothetical protein